MNLHGAQELVRCAVTMGACEGIDKVVPCAFLGLLEVPSCPGVDRFQGLEEQGGPTSAQLVSRYGVNPFKHRPYPSRMGECG